MERKFLYIIIVAVLLILGAVFLALFAKAPTVSVSGVEVSSVNLSAIGITLNLAVNSPYPIDVPVTKLDYSATYLGKEKEILLGSGEQHDIILHPGNQEISIPVIISNPAIISSLWGVLKSGEIAVSVSGNITPDFFGIAPTVPFRKDVTAPLPGKDIISGIGSLAGAVLGSS